MSAKWDRDAGFEPGSNRAPENRPGPPETGWGPWVKDWPNRLPFSYSRMDFSCEIAVRLEYRVPSGHDDKRPD